MGLLLIPRDDPSISSKDLSAFRVPFSKWSSWELEGKLEEWAISAPIVYMCTAWFLGYQHMDMDSLHNSREILSSFLVIQDSPAVYCSVQERNNRKIL